MSAKNTVVTLYSGCNLDSSYVNVYNGSPENVNKNTIGTFTANSYVRPQSNECQLNATISVPLYNCNYAKIENFDGKVFYAFVNSVEYINDNTIKVHFQIDLFGTYYPNCTLQKCYVERQHTENDTIGYNLQPEPVTSAVEFSRVEYYMSVGVGYRLETSSRETDDGVEYKATAYEDGEICATFVDHYTEDGASTLTRDIVRLATNGEANKIVRLCYEPDYLSFRTFQRPTSFDGYVPKNKKCLSGLFQKLVITNNLGQTAEYLYDRGNNGAISFVMEKSSAGDPCVILYPTTYDKITNNTAVGLVYDNFPNIPTITDTYAEWKSNNVGAMITSAIRSISNLGFNTARLVNNVMNTDSSSNPNDMVNAYQNVGNSALDILDTIAMHYDLSSSSSRVLIKNATSTGNINIAINRVGFTAYEIQTRRNEIELIDEFFTRYGYAQNTAMIPNPYARKSFVYIKTRNATVRGTIPNEARILIESVLNGGTTFWNNPDVGNFNLDNSL